MAIVVGPHMGFTLAGVPSPHSQEQNQMSKMSRGGLLIIIISLGNVCWQWKGPCLPCISLHATVLGDFSALPGKNFLFTISCPVNHIHDYQMPRYRFRQNFFSEMPSDNPLGGWVVGGVRTPHRRWEGVSEPPPPTTLGKFQT